MTPSEYEKVKDVFSRALGVPESDRAEFVERECGQAANVADQVLSLLKHHRDTTIFEAHRDTQASALETQVSRPSVVDATQPVDPYLVLSNVWDENRQILRRRLIVFATVIGLLIGLSTLRLFTYQNAEWGYGIRVAALVVCVLCALILHRNPNLTLRQIRFAEILAIANVGLLMIIIDLRLMIAVAAENDEATLISVNNWHYFAWSLIIFIYGVFMPNTWQRAACVLLPIAAIPSLVAMLAGWLEPNVSRLLDEDRFGQPMPTPFVAAAVSIYAAHLIHGARLSAFQARRLAQYKITRLIGEGGMGRVFEAEHLLLKRSTALKIIRPEHCADSRALRRFEREVRATARLTHPNTIEVYDFGQTTDGVFFFAMELLPGMNLQDLVTSYGPLPPSRAVHFLIGVCGALDEAHGAGLIHRDIKPANVFASQRGGICDFVKLLDFGVVREMSVDPGLTISTNRVAGTPTYMSPEQVTAPADVDHRSDLYSLAGVGYFMLTGKPPVAGRSPIEVMLAQVNDPPIPISLLQPDVPADLEAIIMKCLSKDPDQRPGSSRELARALQQCQCAGGWTGEDAACWWKDNQIAVSTDATDATVS